MSQVSPTPRKSNHGNPRASFESAVRYPAPIDFFDSSIGWVAFAVSFVSVMWGICPVAQNQPKAALILYIIQLDGHGPKDGVLFLMMFF